MKVREIAELVGGELRGDADTEIDSAAEIGSARSGQIVFTDGREPGRKTDASCVLAPADAELDLADGPSVILVKNPKLAFARVAVRLHPPKFPAVEIHDSATIADDAGLGNDLHIGQFVSIESGSEIGSGTKIMAGCRIGTGVRIGTDCILHPNVVVEYGCVIGNGVILHSGVVVGADGFGYVKNESGEYEKFPQIGIVVIEDNVEIGANTCIDRAALGETRIGEGTKIDNLVQVGHNVQIGKRCVIAAQTGISGSVVIEDDCVIGGQVGFGDHVRVRSGAVIGSQAGVLPGKIVRPGVWWGTPIQPLEEFKRQHSHMKSIERLKSDVKEIRKKMDASEDDRTG